MDDVLASLATRRSRSVGPLRRLLGLMALSRSRRRLGELDEDLLRDLGLTASEARLEAERPSWNAPSHWLR